MSGLKNLFGGKTPIIPTPKVVRMPSEDDKSVREAARRRRLAARSRGGRQSTIMTDQSVSGSSGRSLGA